MYTWHGWATAALGRWQETVSVVSEGSLQVLVPWTSVTPAERCMPGGCGTVHRRRNSGRGSAGSGVVALTLKSRLREAGWPRPPLSAFLVLWPQGLAQGLARSEGLPPARSSPRSLFLSRRALITLRTLLCFCKMTGQISRPISDVDSQEGQRLPSTWRSPL